MQFYCFLRLVLCVFVLIMAAGFRRAAADSFFEVVTLKVPGEVREVIVEDMDSDGLEDLLVFYNTGEYPELKRTGCLFRQLPAKGFPREADLCWPVPADAALIDTGDLDGKPGKEIYYMTSRGVLYSALIGENPGNSAKLIEESTFLRSSAAGALPEVNFVRDWDGDGRDEALVFGPEQAIFYKRKQGGELALWCEVNLGPHSYIIGEPPSPSLDRNFMFRQSLWMPEIKSIDFDGDGRKDLVVLWMDQLNVHLQGPDGFFSRDPSDTYFFKLLSEKERDAGRTTVHAEVRDLQEDGKADLVLSRIEGGITGAKSKIIVYYNENGRLNQESPELVIDDARAMAGGIIHDVNGDGRMDLIVPSMRMGVLAYINMFVTRQIRVNFAFYIMGKDGHYPQKPLVEKELNFAIDFHQGDIAGALPRLNGDFNGDGKNDVVLAADKDVLTIIMQDENEIFPVDHSYSVSLPVSKEMIVEDVDEDGLSDIIMFYPYHESQHEIIRLLLNRWKNFSK